MSVGPAPRPTPELSVVVASVNAPGYLGRCLASLAAQEDRQAIEVIVVRAGERGPDPALEPAHPEVRWVRAAAPCPIPGLWSLGIRHAEAEIVATVEDHYVFDPAWSRHVRRAHRASGAAAIGGAIENRSGNRSVDWAAFICEYARFMRPFSPGPASALPGPNVSYKRRLLEEACGDLLVRGAWDHVVQARLRSRGLALHRDPAIVAYHAKRFGLTEFLAQRYHFGRAYAAARVSGAPRAVQLAFAAAVPVLPALFLWRYAATLVGNRRAIGHLVRAAPLLVLFAGAWSAGEFCGYALGDGGSSLRVK